MTTFNSGYDSIRKLIQAGIGSSDIKSTKIGIIDGCGYSGIVTASSADDLLMHAADAIIDNADINGGFYEPSDGDMIIEQVTQHADFPGLNRLSAKTWELVHSIIRAMIIDFNVRNEPQTAADLQEIEAMADRMDALRAAKAA